MLSDLMLLRPFDTRWGLTDPFERMRPNWSSSFRPTMGVFPSSEVIGDENGWTIRVGLPGIAPEDVEVNVTAQMVHIRAIERDGDRETTRYEQRIAVPGTVNAEKITATLRHGLLEVTLPVSEAVKPRRIAIDTEDTKKLTA